MEFVALVARQRYEFLPEFAIYSFGMRYAFAYSPKASYAKKRDMCLRHVFRNSYHIARETKYSVYRICEANISHRREAIYRNV